MKRIVVTAAMITLTTGATLAAVGCGQKDPTLEAAPPPSKGAVAEPNMSKQKKMPGAISPAGGGGAAPAPTSAGPQ